MEDEDRQARQAALDDLDQRLVNADDDPRPEAALRDLRALLKAFEEMGSQADTAHLHVALEVRTKVQQLFDQSVHSLEQTLKLGDTAAQLRMPAARKPILDQREKVLDEVKAGIKQLGGTLAALQSLDVAGQTDASLSQLREELDQSLAVANRVEARLQNLLDTATAEVRGQPLTNQQEKDKSMFGAIARWFKAIGYLLTGRIDSARRTIDSDPHVMRAKYDQIIREKVSQIHIYKQRSPG